MGAILCNRSGTATHHVGQQRAAPGSDSTRVFRILHPASVAPPWLGEGLKCNAGLCVGLLDVMTRGFYGIS